MDSFGDGWDNARLVVMPSVGSPYSLGPTCSAAVVQSTFAFSEGHKTGDFVVIGVVGYKPKHSWEVILNNTVDNSIFLLLRQL